MTEIQATYKSQSQSSSQQFGLENQDREIVLEHCNLAIDITSIASELIHCGTMTFEPIASKGTYRVLTGNIECGHIFINLEGTWHNSTTDRIYGTPYEAAAGLFETCTKPVSIFELLDKPFDELTVTEWKLLKTSELQTLNGVPA
ncbi:hypothetical protein AB0758_32965 [Tolypothrix bouteillei VB521301_2]|uniref:Uncharacterized protein n=1 Tax=Tolypothrix bouteillei VB521301 TaxID=1479485 RepID=A0A0C1NM05_9CYAN|nr:hypothetical protein [Tolypothrix bouteillei]KAF3884091.1 hypothetical protein DA73_0400000180 [Tolypothrix bouteillei VB521301]